MRPTTPCELVYFHQGKTSVLWEIAPVKPRSPMQDDHMVLWFAVAAEVYKHYQEQQASRRGHHDVTVEDGSVVVTLARQNVATFCHLDNDQKLAESKMLLSHQMRNGTVKFATNPFFFQEGHAKT